MYLQKIERLCKMLINPSYLLGPTVIERRFLSSCSTGGGRRIGQVLKVEGKTFSYNFYKKRLKGQHSGFMYG